MIRLGSVMPVEVLADEYQGNPEGSYSNEDKHKAPTLLHIRPLSLQDGATRITPWLPSVVKIHQGGESYYYILNNRLQRPNSETTDYDEHG